MKKPNPSPDFLEEPLDHHEERVMKFAKKKGNRKGDYYHRESLEDRRYWS